MICCLLLSFIVEKKFYTFKQSEKGKRELVYREEKKKELVCRENIEKAQSARMEKQTHKIL